MGRNEFFIIAIGGILIAGIVAFLIMRLFSNTPAYERDTNIESNSGVGGVETTIIDEPPQTQGIRYTTGGFIPKEIAVSTDGGGLCLIPVVNETGESLTLRLGPIGEKGISGPQYEAIRAGESIIIDPRFRIPEISFYDLAHPERGSFLVNLGAGCALE